MDDSYPMGHVDAGESKFHNPVEKRFTVPDSFDLEFSNISYSVRKFFFSKERKQLLSNVSGNFRAGELTAIMGPSGAGKSTLMNILAGFITSDVTGDLKVNGQPMKLATFRRSCVYIMQEDHLHDLLTVEEAMNVAAQLKLRVPPNVRQQRITDVMSAMGLEKNRTTMTGRLSGGERKRLAVALELISNVPVMFFDELTSHLDSSTTRQCVELLSSLASEGRTVVCTIHQPSAHLLEFFHHVYVVAGGRCAYSGHPANLQPYLTSLGLDCPKYHNPADFLMEIASGEYGDHLSKLAELTCNGTNEVYRERTCCPATKPTAESSLPSTDKAPESRLLVQPNSLASNVIFKNHSLCWLSEIRVLLWRNIIKLYRDRSFLMGILIVHVLMSGLLSITYNNIGQDANRTPDNVKFLTYNMMFITICALNSTLITFPAEIPIMVRERFNHWYRVSSIYIANIISGSAVVITCATFYISVVYYVSDQILEGWRFGYYLLNCILIGLISQVAGLAWGVGLEVKLAVFLGQYSLTPFILLSEIFVQVKESHKIFQWISKISVFKYCYEGFMLAIYGYDRRHVECNQDFCFYSLPRMILRMYNISHTDYWFSVKVMLGFYVVLHIITFLQLYWKLRK